MTHFIFAHLHLITAVLAVLFGCLLIWAFRGYALVRVGTVSQHLGGALFWLSLQAVARSIWWDVFVGFGLSNASNWMWNSIFLFAAWHALKGAYAAIPAEERHEYNLITCVFYPRRLWCRLKDSGDKI